MHDEAQNPIALGADWDAVLGYVVSSTEQTELVNPWDAISQLVSCDDYRRAPNEAQNPIALGENRRALLVPVVSST